MWFRIYKVCWQEVCQYAGVTVVITAISIGHGGTWRSIHHALVGCQRAFLLNMDPDIWLLIPVKTSQLFFSFLLNCPIKYSTALMAESDFAWAQHSISDISGCSWICSYFPFHCRPLCPLLGLEFIDFPIRQFSEFLEIFMGAHHHVDVISSKGFLRFICQSLSMALSRDHGKFGMLKGWGLMHEEVCVPLRGWHWLTHVETWLLHAIAS